MPDLRPIAWLKGARREFEALPLSVRTDAETALTLAARGGKADNAKPFKGVEGGVFEIVLRHRGDAFRVIYAVQLVPDVLVIGAFQKKSKSGIKTPRQDVDRIRERVRRVQERLR